MAEHRDREILFDRKARQRSEAAKRYEHLAGIQGHRARRPLISRDAGLPLRAGRNGPIEEHALGIGAAFHRAFAITGTRKGCAKFRSRP